MARQTPPAPPSPCLPAAAVTHGSGHDPTHWALHLPSFQAEVLRSRTPRLSDAALPPTHPPTSTRPPSHADHMLATPTSSQVRGRAPLVNACAGHRSEGSSSAPPSSASRAPQRSPTERISATCGMAAAQAAGCQRAVRWKLRLASPVASSPWCAAERVKNVVVSTCKAGHQWQSTYLVRGRARHDTVAAQIDGSERAAC